MGKKPMKAFEAILEKATAKGANNVPGAAMAVVDKDGKYVYKKVAGYSGVAEDAKPLKFDQTFFVASCTKLVTSIAAMQCVERGLIGLDDTIDNYLPELAAQPVASLKSPTEFELKPAKNSITLRQLVTHSSGVVYDSFDPAITLWRASHNETPNFPPTDGLVATSFAYPRAFDAGESWMYGGGLDWTSLLVARLNNVSFEDYVTKHIAKPLHLKAFTWHLSRHPEVGKKLMASSFRGEDGKLVPGTTPPWPEPVGEGGGAGIFTTVHDYTRVLADLLKDKPVLLSPSSIDQFFSPQFAPGSGPAQGMVTNDEQTWGPVLGAHTDGVSMNHGLGGALVMEDVDRKDYFKPKGTLTWSGMLNLMWSVNRERGLALFYATQVLPWNDAKTFKLASDFETAVWREIGKC
ncbi:beta-lactamase/transpeptidase-like protein [Massariosphaeria phaeospora]|uniref:Beta-lactamase/transpeptidase-like protein n=1 Tax=Massariosphaeria phaeospora TaxID=100035 RepID=A0A7C8I962_9PLEO|nr:beta-lactamase/transpeptidase-like protein [Massariosphaeria phaeospora]